MKRKVTSKEMSSNEILTHFTCKKRINFVTIIFRNLFNKLQTQYANSVCVFQNLYRVQCCRLLLSVASFEFQNKLLVMSKLLSDSVSPECNVKLSVAFLLFLVLFSI